MVKTSLYTKTIDYLAATRPVLVISPAYSSQVDYFGDVTHVLSSLDHPQIEQAIRKLTCDIDYVEDLARRGLELVQRRHSMQAVHSLFLRHFEREGDENAA